MPSRGPNWALAVPLLSVMLNRSTVAVEAPPLPPGGVNVLVAGRANPCTFANIGKTAWPNNSKPNNGTLFVVLTKTHPPSEARCRTWDTNSDSNAVRRPAGSASRATEPTNWPALSIAYISTLAVAVVVFRSAIPVYQGERLAICPKKKAAAPDDCDGTIANDPFVES